MSNIINTAADCNVKQFMDCAFASKYKVLLIDGEATDEELKAAFEYIYDQYVDYSGLFQTREFELSSYMHSLDVRINTIQEFIRLQRKFVDEFQRPFVEGFSIVKKYGHTFYWNPDSPQLDLFLARLTKVEQREAKYKSELKAKEKELFDLQRKRATKEFTLLESKKQFILTLVRLEQAKYVINKKETSVEDLAIMIKDQKDQNEDAAIQRSFKKTR